MTSVGARNRLIIIERAGAETDDGYTTRPGEYSEFTRAWAEVLFGTGQERRQAAQEAATAPATFILDWNHTAAQIAPTDRISALGSYWDITSAIPVGLNKEIHITATRSS